jgi:hypothetical protein
LAAAGVGTAGAYFAAPQYLQNLKLPGLGCLQDPQNSSFNKGSNLVPQDSQNFVPSLFT